MTCQGRIWSTGRPGYSSNLVSIHWIEMIYRRLHWLHLVVLICVLSACNSDQTTGFDDIFHVVETVTLDSGESHLIGLLPNIGAVLPSGDYLILDVSPRVGVYDEKGKGKKQIGRDGSGPGEYRYPVSVAFHDGNLYLYDSTLSRITCYDGSYDFKSDLITSAQLHDIHVSDEGRFFGYRSTDPDKVVVELDDQGEVLNRFVPQSVNYNQAADASGGGIVLLNGFLYVITPYEYLLAKYTFDGEHIKSVPGRSPHYVPPPVQFDVEILYDLAKRSKYHEQWSHIRQLVLIDGIMLGVVFAEPGEERVYLDIYDVDLNLVTTGVQLPEHMGGPAALVTRANRLYMLEEPADDLANPSVVVYELRQPLGAL